MNLQLACLEDLQESLTATPRWQQHKQPKQERRTSIFWHTETKKPKSSLETKNRERNSCTHERPREPYPFWWGTLPWSIESAEFPHYYTKAENVTFFWEGFIANKFRSHPFRSTGRWGVAHSGVGHYSRQPKIADLYRPMLIYKTICTFYVAMHYLHPVYAHQPPAENRS